MKCVTEVLIKCHLGFSFFLTFQMNAGYLMNSWHVMVESTFFLILLISALRNKIYCALKQLYSRKIFFVLNGICAFWVSSNHCVLCHAVQRPYCRRLILATVVIEEQNVFPLLTICESPAEILEWVSFCSFIISVMWLLQSVLKAVSQNVMAHDLAYSDLACWYVTVVLHISWRIFQTCQYVQQSMRQKCGLTYHHSYILHNETYWMCVGQYHLMLILTGFLYQLKQNLLFFLYYWVILSK